MTTRQTGRVTPQRIALGLLAAVLGLVIGVGVVQVATTPSDRHVAPPAHQPRHPRTTTSTTSAPPTPTTSTASPTPPAKHEPEPKPPKKHEHGEHKPKKHD